MHFVIKIIKNMEGDNHDSWAEIVEQSFQRYAPSPLQLNANTLIWLWYDVTNLDQKRISDEALSIVVREITRH